MTNGIALLPCPLCGTPPNGPTRISGGFGPDWLIVCPACLLKLERYGKTNGPDDPVRAQMIEAWNRRAGTAVSADFTAVPNLERN